MRETEPATFAPSASARAFSFRGVKFESLASGFAWRDGDLYVSDATIGLGGGKIRGDLMKLTGDVRLRVECHADPTPLTAFLSERDRGNIAKLHTAMNPDFFVGTVVEDAVKEWQA